SLIHSPFCLASLGVCEASTKSVALPWPPWHVVHPNFSAGCGLLASTNRSRRGWTQYSLICASSRLTVRSFVGNSGGSKVNFSPFALRSSRSLRASTSFFSNSSSTLSGVNLASVPLVNAERSRARWQVVQRSKRVTYLKL